MSTRYARIKDLFLAALDVPAAERDAFVEARTPGDPDLRAEVQSLLAHEGAPILREPEPAPEPPRPDPIGAVGAVIEGRYKVVELVDEGGFSYVYRGEQVRLKRPVALKFFNEQRGEQRAALERAFVNEGALLGELSRRTTTIVQSYDAGTWSRGGVTFLYNVLEWLDGETLARRLARERAAGAGGWSIAQVVETLEPIADALAIAFDLGIAHRDLKPGNVFLAEVGGRTVPKLIDFGTAKVADDRGFQRDSSVVGVFTIAYAAPEQVARTLGPTGPWTDVYALALLCIELLLGRPPFTRDDLASMARRIHGKGAPLTAADFKLDLPPAVDHALSRALATNPKDRYPDVRQLWAALRTAMA